MLSGTRSGGACASARGDLRPTSGSRSDSDRRVAAGAIAHQPRHLATDIGALPDLVDQIESNTGRRPRKVLADAGYASDNNLAALETRGIDAYLAVRRERHGTSAAPARRGRIPAGLSRTGRMARKLKTKRGRAWLLITARAHPAALLSRGCLAVGARRLGLRVTTDPAF